MKSFVALAVVLGVLAAGCDFGIRLSGSPTAPAVASAPGKRAKPSPTAVAAADDLGPKPTLGAPKTFEPAAPQVFQGPNGITVWLVERPAIPLVTAAFVVPYGSASDPADRPGTMHLVADMLDEGAGKRGALELSDAVAALGASLSVYATADGSFAQVSSLRGKFDDAFAILADVVARPKLDVKEFARVKKLWKNGLKKRADEPTAVANVVASSVLYDQKAPYGHPTSGLLSKADLLDLGALRGTYERTWRPDRATLVVVGQINKSQVEALLATHLGSWKQPGEALPAPKLTTVLAERPRLVLVDRPKAVQTVILVARDGIVASDERAPSLSLINAALGGSFTSRLNLNLREEKGWTYGVGSVFQATRGQGTFYVKTEVEAGQTGPSVKEILGELSKMSASGLTPDELGKVKALDRGDLVETYETASGSASRLAQLVSIGLPPGYDASASRVRQGASLDDLTRLAKAHLDPAGFTIVLVGDRENVTKQIADLGLGEPVLYSVEGQSLGAPKKKADPPKKK